MYLVDSNVLIDAKNRYYAFDIAPGFWAWLEVAHAAGEVGSIEAVHKELVDGNDELAEWAKANRSFFQPINQDTTSHFPALTAWAVTRPYTQAALADFTGNNADYEPYLKAIGAAEESDNIFAASCYCPITDLDNADTAYEWLFNGINNYSGRGGVGTLTPDQIKVSDQLKSLFPAHLNSLGLKTADRTSLTLDANGDGPFKDYVKSFVISSAQKALRAGKNLSDLNWITIKDGTVTDIDFGRFHTRIAPE